MNPKYYKNYKQLGENIWEAREGKGLTRQELAEKAGISESHLYRIEEAKTGISLKVVYKISCALDVEPNTLFYDME